MVTDMALVKIIIVDIGDTTGNHQIVIIIALADIIRVVENTPPRITQTNSKLMRIKSRVIVQTLVSNNKPTQTAAKIEI